MFIYHTVEGEILYTVNLGSGATPPAGLYIEVADQDIEPHQWRVENGVLVAQDSLMLSDARERAITTINNIAGEVRARFITVIPGQEMLYMQKEQEAIAWLTATDPVLKQYPLIAAEVGITAPEPGQVAQVYVNMAAMLRQTAATLETLRLGAVAVVENATSVEMISAAVTRFEESINENVA